MKRSEYARSICPDASPRDAGKHVARLIMSVTSLKVQMEALGYEPNKVGYSAAMVRCLDEFFRNNPQMKTP